MQGSSAVGVPQLDSLLVDRLACDTLGKRFTHSLHTSCFLTVKMTSNNYAFTVQVIKP